MRLLAFLLFVPVFAQDGAAIYQKQCAACHDGGAGRAPRRDVLKQMSPESVMNALTQGTMALQGMALSNAEVRSVSAFVTGKSFGGEETSKQGVCPDPSPAFDQRLAGPRWNGWGAGSENHRSQPADMAGLSADQVPRLKLKWAFGFPNVVRAFAQPTVAGGRIFVGSSARKVYSLDAATGCVYWTFDADSAVRSAISIGSLNGRWAAYFGDQGAHAYAVDAATGKLMWKTQVEDFRGAVITGAPALVDGRLFVPVSSMEEVLGANPKYECCKFRGSVTALDAATGKQIWKSFTVADTPAPVRKSKSGVQLWGPSGAGVWSSPTVDLKKRAVYVTTGDSYSEPAARTSDAFVAFDVDTGKLLWSRQMTAGDAFTVDCIGGNPTNCPDKAGPDFDFGSSPILVNLPNGKRALVAGQKSGMVHAVDPDQQGEVLWQKRLGKGSALGGIQWGSAFDGTNVYAALSDVDFSDQGLSVGKPPVLNPEKGGGLFAIRVATGEQVWHAPPVACGDRKGCSPAQSAAVTHIPGVVFSGDLGGRLHAYSTEDGRIIWEVDTAREYQTVNGVKAKGGAIDGPGPVVVGGMLYVNSGYAALGGAPGNVLLAFSVDGK